MKKLLSMIGAIALTTATSTSIIACGEEKPPIDKKIDISNFKDLDLGTIETNGKDLTVNMIKDKLPTNIENEVNITNITNISATLTAKSNSIKYKGSVIVTYSLDKKIDIKITNTINLGQLHANTKADFLEKLQIALAQIKDLNTIKTSDYDVYKAGTTTAIQDSDIINSTNFLTVKITVKNNSLKFKGETTILVSYIKNKYDISWIKGQYYFYYIQAYNLEDVIAKLHFKIVNEIKNDSISMHDYIIYKAGTKVTLVDKDIDFSQKNIINIPVDIVAKGDNFKGTANIELVLKSI
ncbi:lipoprotein [Spiroplasma endosymbiont of Villa modesta]|uniref:lipoprotein n=1 Tax=Spiroplasma endosymbiont of Villa modesta TaxID=3066293 RepID=UPI00313EB1EC